MTILVLGRDGQVGSSLHNAFQKTDYNVIFTNRSNLDITNIKRTEEYILTIKPQVVINVSGYTEVDKAEIEKEEANRVNNIAVGNIADACLKVGSWLIHLSSDYVFDGTSEYPYTEEDETNPISQYGQSKLNGELAIKSTGYKFLIIRTSWVFSQYGNNFLKTMLRLSSSEKEIKIVGDQSGCPTFAGDIAEAIISTLPFLDAGISSGIYHYAGYPPCTWVDFAHDIFDQAYRLKKIRSKPRIKEITTEEYSALAKRPMYSILNSDRFERVFRNKPSEWVKGIDTIIRSLDGN